jgi:Tfp pilus assembly protein PilF
VNRLLQHSAIVLFALCPTVVPPFATVLAAAVQPDVAQRHYERGAALLKKGDLAPASEAVRKAIALNPSSAEAHHLLGLIYFKEKKAAQAVDAFSHAIKLKPAYPDALNDLAEVYLIQGKSSEAKQALRQAVEIDPRHADSYFQEEMRVASCNPTSAPRRC